ncbi:MAG: shikimate kinase [Geodermatophilaceae bacterium]|nr:shikimate kinase [Geodermatophilaceae bacterium]MDQ3474966.1 shikimate kinase [Actinomycetota bacterium]
MSQLAPGGPPTHRPVAVLVGVPGAGKSTVGRVLARALGVSFRDTDRDVEQIAGKSVSDIFVDEGEDHFRRLERAAVAAALLEHDGVLALGGGAILDAGTRALLADQRVIWLRVDVPAAAKRVGLARNRPLLAMNPRAHLRELMAARAPLYAEVATDTIEASHRSVSEIVDQLHTSLSRTNR